MDIKLELAYEQPEVVRELFAEYMDMLIAGDERIKEYLVLQNYDDEVDNLEGKYGLPDGRLYLLYCDGKVAGCIALKRFDEVSGELKCLYLKPQFRGNKLGNVLVEQIISDAREIGYSYILLDTLPYLQSAIHLYKKYGFYEVPRHNDSPMDTSIYMRLDL